MRRDLYGGVCDYAMSCSVFAMLYLWKGCDFLLTDCPGICEDA